MTLSWPTGQFRKPQEFLENVFIIITIFFTFVVNTIPTILGLFEWTFSKMYPGVPLNHDLELADTKGGGRGTGLIWRLAVKRFLYLLNFGETTMPKVIFLYLK